MAVAQYQLIFAATNTQYLTMLVTTLPTAGFVVTPTLQNNTGIVQAGTSTGTGQTDYSYDGMNFVTFFGGNMTAAMVTALTTALAGTLGAPVPPNLAVPPPFVS